MAERNRVLRFEISVLSSVGLPMKFNVWSICVKLAGLATIALICAADLAVPVRSVNAEQLSPSFPVRPELEQLSYFQGTWRCEQPGESSSAEPVALIWTVKRDLNNFWYVGYGNEMTSATNRNPVNSREFLGYDANANRFVRLVVVGNGNSLNLSSPGWQGKRFVWDGTLIQRGESIPIREVITKEGNQQFVAIYFVRNKANNDWKPVINEVCERQS